MEEDEPKKVIKMSDIKPPSEKVKLPEKIELPEKKVEPEVPTLDEYRDVGKEEIKPEVEPEVEPEEEPEAPEVEEPVEEEPEEPIFPEDIFAPKVKKARKKRILVFISVLCLVVLGFVGYLTLSRAEIIIKPKTETMHFQTELGVDKNVAFVDLDNNKIPGQLFQVEKEEEREFLATEEKELREKAKGTITVYNQYSSAPQTLVKTTRFVSEKGKLFRTTKTIIIPGAKVEEGQIIPSTIDVEIVAAEPGKEYNIGPSSFTIPGFEGTAKYTGFYGKSTQPMVGGIIGKVKIVSADDIKGAKDVLAVELKGKAKKELEKRVPSDLKILKDTMLEEVTESSSDVEAGQAAEKFTVITKVAVKVLGFNEDDAISLINENLKGKISESKALVPDTISLNYTVTDINLNKGLVRLTCEVKEDVAWEVDIEEIRRTLAGKSEIKVRQYLASRDEIESARVIFWPFWVKKIPVNEKKIKITLD